VSRVLTYRKYRKAIETLDPYLYKVEKDNEYAVTDAPPDDNP
jgi:hypothetical protein